MGSIVAEPQGHKFYVGLYSENLRNFPVPSHKA